jgi:hypothetical protein
LSRQSYRRLDLLSLSLPITRTPPVILSALTPVPQYIDRAPLGTGGRRALAVVSLTVAIALGAWIVAILVTGGMNTRVFGITIRAHGIARPATFGAAALAVFLWTRGFSRTLTTVSSWGSSTRPVSPADRIRTAI